MNSNPFNKYKSNSVSVASPAQLTLMLVDGAVRDTKVAKLALERGDSQRAHNELIRVQNIYKELMSCLDPNANELSKELLIIYECIRQKLIEANIRKDVKIIEEVLPLIEAVRDEWYKVKQQYDLEK